MANYVLGIDGGGTKTHCALFDVSGKKIDFVQWGTTSHEVLDGGFNGFEEEIKKLIYYILDKNNIKLEEIKSAVFGLAGVDTAFQHKVISQIIKDIGIEKFILCNDAYLGIKAGSKEGIGICVINGTGNTIAGIDPINKMLQIGGQGEYTGDLGGGGGIGSKAIKAVYNYLFKCDEYTIMSEILFERLNITSKFEFIETIIDKENKGEISISTFSDVVFIAANMGDQIALKILEAVGRDCGRAIKGMLLELNFPRTNCVNIILAGSVIVKGENSTLVDYIKLEACDQEEYTKLNFIILEKPPVAGAVIWALENIGYSENNFEKILPQL
jgi:N-acetylglucosamine kinase-like BadF-type ATPase